MLKNFRDKISASASVVAAAAVTGAANSMQQFEARSTITAAAAAQARQQRIMKLAEQRQMSRGSQVVAAQDVVQVAKATKRGGKNIQKKCSACGQHKTKETGHTITTCPTHCLKCRQPWLTITVTVTAAKPCSCQP